MNDHPLEQTYDLPIETGPVNPTLRRRSRLRAGLSFAWAAAIVYGIGQLMTYELQPAQVVASSLTLLPASTALAATSVADVKMPTSVVCAKTAGRPTLWMTLHPRCPCSKASVAELRDLLQHVGSDQVDVRVLFSQPDSLVGDPANTSLWSSVQDIPGVQTIRDVGGYLAQELDARTSGEVLLFDAGGRLRFRGGITPARGMVGANEGVQLVRSLIAGTGAAQVPTLTTPAFQTPVFGCSLR